MVWGHGIIPVSRTDPTFLVFFWSHGIACGILLPRQGMEPTSPALEAWSLNHWTTREVSCVCVCMYAWSFASLLCPWDSPGKNTGVGGHFLLHGVFLTQGSPLHLFSISYWQAGSLPLASAGKPEAPETWQFIQNTKPFWLSLSRLLWFVSNLFISLLSLWRERIQISTLLNTVIPLQYSCLENPMDGGPW